MTVILTILCSLYGTYCTAFCCTLGYTLYKENKEEKEKRKIKIKLEYTRLQSISEVDEFIDHDNEESINQNEILHNEIFHNEILHNEIFKLKQFK